jgi:16S rRNA (cytidine1402-2'-O)-methyltransferase
MLADLATVCGGVRRVSVSRELTKLHEETWRGPLADAPLAPAVVVARGEYVVVVEAAPPLVADSAASMTPLFEKLYAAGLGRRDAVAAVEVLLDVAHRDAYAAALTVPLPVPGSGKLPPGA